MADVAAVIAVVVRRRGRNVRRTSIKAKRKLSGRGEGGKGGKVVVVVVIVVVIVVVLVVVVVVVIAVIIVSPSTTLALRVLYIPSKAE